MKRDYRTSHDLETRTSGRHGDLRRSSDRTAACTRRKIPPTSKTQNAKVASAKPHRAIPTTPATCEQHRQHLPALQVKSRAVAKSRKPSPPYLRNARTTFQ